MKSSRFTIEDLLSSFPDKREELLPHIARLKQYRSECGCALGSKFLLASIAIWTIYFLLFATRDFAHLLKLFLVGILFIFFSSIAGKLTGITLAKVRLALLNRHPKFKYRP